MVDQLEELGSGALPLKGAAEVARRRDRILLLHPAHLHAEVPRLDHHHHAEWVERFLDAVLDLPREPLLYLQAAREDVYNASQLAQSGDMPIGNVGDVYLAEEGEHMMLAEGVKLDVLHDHHLAVVVLKGGSTEHRLGILMVASGECLERLGDAYRRLLEAIAVGVLTQLGEDLTGELSQSVGSLLQFLRINLLGEVWVVVT